MKLTHQILLQLGFRGEGKGITNNPLYRLDVPQNKRGCYHYQIQMELGDYPESNPNSGILSLYDPSIKNAHMIMEDDEKEKVDYVMWETKDRGDGNPSRGGIKFIDIKERQLHIAWHVTTLERLNKIYVALTDNPPLELKTKK